MMQQAFADIESANLLIARVSDKSMGVGIGIGCAVATHKPGIYLRNIHAAHSTTAAGSAHHIVIYPNSQELAQKLAAVLSILALQWNSGWNDDCLRIFHAKIVCMKFTLIKSFPEKA